VCFSLRLFTKQALGEREQARRRLGASFALPGFHDVVPKTGSVPLYVLGEVVNAWVEST